jgi:hypothetical protein
MSTGDHENFIADASNGFALIHIAHGGTGG